MDPTEHPVSLDVQSAAVQGCFVEAGTLQLDVRLRATVALSSLITCPTAMTFLQAALRPTASSTSLVTAAVTDSDPPRSAVLTEKLDINPVYSDPSPGSPSSLSAVRPPETQLLQEPDEATSTPPPPRYPRLSGAAAAPAVSKASPPRAICIATAEAVAETSNTSLEGMETQTDGAAPAQASDQSPRGTSRLLSTMNAELQKISLGWRESCHSFERTAEGLEATLESQRHARAAHLRALRSFQEQCKACLSRFAD